MKEIAVIMIPGLLHFWGIIRYSPWAIEVSIILFAFLIKVGLLICEQFEIYARKLPGCQLHQHIIKFCCICLCLFLIILNKLKREKSSYQERTKIEWLSQIKQFLHKFPITPFWQRIHWLCQYGLRKTSILKIQPTDTEHWVWKLVRTEHNKAGIDVQ